MQCVRMGVGAIIALMAMQSLAFGESEPAEELTRTVPALKCRFTLPNSDWHWLETDGADARFAAVNSRGIAIILTATHEPGVGVGKTFAKSFDRSYFVPGQREKRKDAFVTFLGLPCYEVSGRRSDSNTTSMKIFAAHDYIYILNVMGSSDPVEDDPAYLEALGGFEFTADPAARPAPAAADSEEERTARLQRAMGGVIFLCLLGAGALGLAVYLNRKDKSTPAKERPKKRRSDSIFFEDDE